MTSIPCLTRLTLALAVIIATLLGWPTPARALGPPAPPLVTFAGAWISTITTDHEPGPTSGVPQLFASVDVLIPNGDVPANVQSVTVQVPGEGSPRTMFKDTGDLFPDVSYFINLTTAGVVGFPTGTYTFTITDTAGGVTTKSDDLTTASGLAAPTGVSIAGATGISADAFRAGFTLSSTPTVTWTPAPGSVIQRVRVRTFSGPDVFSGRINNGATNSLTLPAGVFVPGRLYQVAVESEDASGGLPDSNSRGRRNVQLFVDGPEIQLFSTGGAADGQTLTILANILNNGGPTTVDARAWIGVPTGQVVTLFTVPGITLSHATPTAPAGSSTLFSGPIFSHTFGGEPTGRYVLGITFVDSVLGQVVATQTISFNR